jgi:phosphoribosylamine--glycine ligase
VLYAGLILTAQNQDLEFVPGSRPVPATPHADETDIVPILLAVADGDISKTTIEWHDKAAVCVVMPTVIREYRKAES